MLSAATAPFVLLDDARESGVPARLYRNPVQIIEARTIAEVRPALEAVREGAASGLHAAGFLAYEAGAAFEPSVGDLPMADIPLLWFGLFDAVETIAADDVPAHLPDPAGAWIGTPEPSIDRARYDVQLERVLALIAAGDLYQANLTFRAAVPLLGDPLAAYARLRAASRAGWGAVVATGSDTILSLSPELFFALDGGALECRPMKGTAPRGTSAAEDARLAADLAADAKQRAENLMIVDLMRNDLSRVATPGSVAVPALFEVERYPTVHQMVSRVTAELAYGNDAIDVLAALYPCGSITGAPKVRAMQAIRDIEDSPRGIYTGAIGHIDPDGGATFNVAIRTLHLKPGSDTATLGIGSGIVADSRADEEWAECLAKAAFVTRDAPRFDLFETMRFDPVEGLLHLEDHLGRMRDSAETFGFAFDRHEARNELQAATFRLREPARIKLALAPSGAIAIEVRSLPATPDRMRVAVVPLPVASSDIRLRHKTTARGFYDAARHAADADEVVFVDADGFLTEGSFTNVFVEREGRLVTPPLSRGLLPGVLRARLIADGAAIEGDLTPADLADGCYIGNALRGLMVADVTVAARSSASL
ncbi:Para-aminobenzoate synthetase / 4-amino-4-deoxychorismate lyase [Sphingomonas sp. EC-HK361]|uniref:aminodeoxychorismate synthase component I n=1 Tax=Sphingomonas sp. EC-HK361 TaxID=2038397 RepID=UPI00125C1013|nr:aminodeoxychorismate synthase component I [Sphingomonas sp. EC-HK361]VVT06572.1 Para-aminobenzoate synthetase / 4-amino-4-deoxychorismate lyase [Sphingomonas sp. EC-HK361]